MNIDEMLAGRELDALMAEKVMGFKWDEKQCRVCGWLLDLEGKMCRPDNCSERPLRKGDQRADAHAYYSTDIAAAWYVLEKLNTLRDGGVGVCRSTKELVCGPWVVVDLQYHDFDVLAEADTAALAICRAALKAVSV